jgi:hypothetical protein
VATSGKVRENLEKLVNLVGPKKVREKLRNFEKYRQSQGKYCSKKMK